MVLILLTITTFVLSSVSAENDCTSPREKGNSCSDRPSRMMFYFDSKMGLFRLSPRYVSGVCQPFMYQGCGGNKNRYASSEACKKACTGPKDSSSSSSNSGFAHSPGSQWLHAEKCGANFLIPNHEYIKCIGGDKLCPASHTCKNDVCCPTKKFVCNLRDDTGNFADGIDDKPRFAWDHSVQSCVRFSYYGAGGNYNNFPNFQSCMKYCQDQ